ncbi:MAG TPA: Holliday junction branch migration protein RuvA [Verrucomicrobiales bacterium]|nr:Holliday junction branch migration protein RuvA [Verrucomicrobiales bacterium]
MITFLQGILVEALPHQAIIEVQGVGYEVAIPLSTYQSLAEPGTQVRLLTHLQVREDAHTLFGFSRSEERDLFRLLVQRVSGVGPRVALAILGGISLRDFQRAVVEGDASALARVKGLGVKTAERIILELKDKLGLADAWNQEAPTKAGPPREQVHDAVLALVALGYRQADASKAIRRLASEDEAWLAISTEELIRQALRLLQ